MKYLILDFNGTVINDVDISIAAINFTAKKYLVRDYISKEEYLNVFTFPVKNYYEALGFDFEKLSWEEVGKCWMDQYQIHRNEAKVFDGVKDLLIKAHNLGYKTVVLSASEIELLKSQLKELGIYDYFDVILGIDNIYASSKLPVALNFMKDKNPKDCIFVGDSRHDKEVADAMGVKCYLVAKGHESKERLLKISNNVLDDIKEVELWELVNHKIYID